MHPAELAPLSAFAQCAILSSESCTVAPRFLGWVLTCGLFLLSIPLPLRVGAGLAPALGDRKGSPLPFSYAPSHAFSAAPFGPFSEIWPVLVLILLVLAALAIGISRWRIASIESRNRQLAVEVAERTLTIAVQTADLEALYQADEELERHVQLDQVLQALVDIAVDRLHADKSAVLAWDDGRRAPDHPCGAQLQRTRPSRRSPLRRARASWGR